MVELRTMNSRVLITGVFDIIHPGHLKLFNYGRNLTRDLYIAIDSDIRVKQMKGQSRPIIAEVDRVIFLQELGFFKDIFVFNDEKSYRDLVVKNQIDHLLIGEEWRSQPEKILGHELFQEILFYPRNLNWSTTKLIEVIRDKK